jgi:hypothetical protein
MVAPVIATRLGLDWLVEVMEELYKFTLLVRGRSDYLPSRYNEQKEAMPHLAMASTAVPAAGMNHEVAPNSAQASDLE